MKCSVLKEELEKYIRDYDDFDVNLFVVTPHDAITVEKFTIDFENDCFVIRCFVEPGE